jgi:hypothetical protein
MKKREVSKHHNMISFVKKELILLKNDMKSCVNINIRIIIRIIKL